MADSRDIADIRETAIKLVTLYVNSHRTQVPWEELRTYYVDAYNVVKTAKLTVRGEGD